MIDHQSDLAHSPNLAALTQGRYHLVPIPNDNSPVHLAMALPVGGDEPGNSFLPVAARMGTGRTPSGRGLSKQEAVTRTLGEAAQLISSCFWGDEQTIRGRAADMGSNVISPDDILLISDRQFGNRDEWNVANGDHDWMPQRFDLEQKTDWVEFSSLDGISTAFAPAACVYIGAFEKSDDGAFCVADSNGTAAGETLEQAKISAFLELVERDATAMWWHGRYARPAVDLSKLCGGDMLLDWLKSRRRRYQIIDITTDLGIPVYAAISAEPDGSAVALGFSASFNPDYAAISALTEMCQIEVSVNMAVTNREMMEGNPLLRWLDEVSLISMKHLQPLPGKASNLSSVRPESTLSPVEQIDRISAICADHNLTPWVHDLTRAEIGVPVARVIVPGLRHFKARYAQGRLYDTPLAMGWCSSPYQETDLNRVPLII